MLPTIEADQEIDESEQTVYDEPAFNANEKEFDPRVLIKKTSPEPCDQEMWLYTLVHKNISGEAYNRTMTNDCTR